MKIKFAIYKGNLVIKIGTQVLNIMRDPVSLTLRDGWAKL